MPSTQSCPCGGYASGRVSKSLQKTQPPRVVTQRPTTLSQSRDRDTCRNIVVAAVHDRNGQPLISGGVSSNQELDLTAAGRTTCMQASTSRETPVPPRAPSRTRIYY